MKTLQTSLLVLGLAGLTLAGCKEDTATPVTGENGVQFTATITNVTRASDASWDDDDQIGIYMVTNGGTVGANSLAENAKYVNSGFGYFTPADAANALNYPSDGSAVDFVAYYPYTDPVVDYTYNVDVSEQSVPEVIDLLYSSNASGLTKANPIVNLVFRHQLSKIVLNITDLTGDGLDGTTIEMAGMPTRAAYDLTDGTLAVDNGSVADFAMNVATDDLTGVAEAIVLPGSLDYQICFTFADGLVKDIEMDGAVYEAGKKYIYDVVVSDKIEIIGRATIIDWDEVPSGDLEVDKGALPKNLPLVFDVEHRTINNPLPPLPDADNLPDVYGLPDPFAWSDGSGRVTRYDEWADRRAEIIAEICNYEIGVKPVRPDDITASYENGVLTVNVTENGYTLTLTSQVNLPSGDGPFPVMIGMNSTPTGSYFSDCIRIPFNATQVANYDMWGGRTRTHPFWQMYPDLHDNGDYSAWAWGVSRLIDGLEIVAEEMGANMKAVGVIGCSYAGKMALFSGALDERIALTLVQESGGGGINSWRVSDTIPEEIGEEVERINNTSYTWFMQALKDNFMDRSHKLPYDHHELIALIAPRAVLIYGNYGWVWMADKSGYISTMGAYEVWKAMGVEDRIGWDFTGDHGHCSMCASQVAATELFVNKFLHGIDGPTETVRTDSDHADVDYHSWIKEWEGHKLR